jgi:hypothetical protein
MNRASQRLVLDHESRLAGFLSASLQAPVSAGASLNDDASRAASEILASCGTLRPHNHIIVAAELRGQIG